MAVADVQLEQLKAAFIYKFALYIEWPKKTEPFTIAVLKNQELYKSMKDAFEGKSIGERKVIVNHIETIEKSTKFDILHINDISATPGLMLDKLPKSGLLIITHSKSIHPEAIINFYQDEANLKFEINADRAISNNLKINSRLLNLSRNQKWTLTV